jgi:hypothetical protein
LLSKFCKMVQLLLYLYILIVKMIMKQNIILLLFSLGIYFAQAQNVGIGIAAPTQKLHVADGVSPNTATIRVSGLSSATALPAGTAPYRVVMVDANGVLYRGGSAGTGNTDAWYTTGNAGTNATTNFVGTTDAIDFVTRTNNVERMRVTSTGNVGIGTGAPAVRLHVPTGNLYAGQTIRASAASDGFNAGIIETHNQSDGTLWHITHRSGEGNRLIFWRFNGSWANVMTLTMDQNVGIATTYPFDRLHVAFGNTRIGEVNPPGTGTFPGFGRRLIFSGGPAPGAINDSENTDPIWFARYNRGSDSTELRLNISDNCNSNVDAFVIQSGGDGCSVTDYFRFTAAGNAYKPAGGLWFAISDARLKQNIQPFTLGLNSLMSVKPVTYSYNGLAGTPNGGKEYVGVIAQDIQQTLPFMVESFDGKYLSVDGTPLIYMLINSVKELNQKNIASEKENQILRNEIEQMKKDIRELQEALKTDKR